MGRLHTRYYIPSPFHINVYTRGYHFIKQLQHHKKFTLDVKLSVEPISAIYFVIWRRLDVDIVMLQPYISWTAELTHFGLRGVKMTHKALSDAQIDAKNGFYALKLA